MGSISNDFISDVERFAAIIFGIIAVALVIWLVFALVEYIFQGLGLYRMAANAGLSSPVLAWIPVANGYLLGLLCERSMYRRTGRAWKFSVILPVMELLAVFGGSTLSVFGSIAENYFYSDYGSDLWENMNFPPVGSLLGIAFTVVTAIALYNLYWDYGQGKEVLYTVLSVLFGGVARAVILFILRDRMPISAQGGGWEQPWTGSAWQGQQPFQNSPYTTNPGASPYQGQGGQFYQGQPPYQGGGYPGGGQWNPGGPNTTQWWNPQPPYHGYPQYPQSPTGASHDPNDPPPTGQGPEDKQ